MSIANALSTPQNRALLLFCVLGVPFTMAFTQDNNSISQEVRQLEERFKSGDGPERASAARRLGEFGEQASSAAPSLRLAFEDEFPDARINAIMAYRAITGEVLREGALGLVGLLDDEDYIVRWNASGYLASSFVKTKPEQAPWAHELVPALIESLDDENSWVRMGAAQALCTLGSEAHSALPVLIGRIKVEEHRGISGVLPVLVEAIGTTAGSSPKAIEALIELLSREYDLPTIDAAVEALGAIGPDAIPALIVAMQGEDADLAFEAVRALWCIDPLSGRNTGDHSRMLALPALIELTEHENEELQRMAVRTLGKVGWQAHEATPQLVKALKSPHVKTRRAAAWSLGEFANFAAESASALDALRNDPDPRLRAAATAAHRSVTRKVR